MENLSSTFDQHFKFTLGQKLRHKGDHKDQFGSHDMGLLVLARSLHEEANSDDVVYEKTYHCRIIAFSGSGGVQQFKEHELQSVEDWRKDAINSEVERELMRKDIHRVENDILGQFGISKDDRFYVKSEDGTFDKTKEYRTTGFKSNKETGKYEISVRQINTLQSGMDSFYLSDKDQIEVIK